MYSNVELRLVKSENTQFYDAPFFIYIFRRRKHEVRNFPVPRLCDQAPTEEVYFLNYLN